MCCRSDHMLLAYTAGQFARTTSMHGLKYIVYCQRGGGGHIMERVMWALICLCAIILGLYFCSIATQSYYRDPSIIQLAKVSVYRRHANVEA